MFKTGLMTTAAVALAWGLSSGGLSAAETKKSDASLCLAAMAGGGADMKAEARLQKLDTDGNGFVSSEEFTNCLKDMFAKLDANADDRLSADELQKGHASMMQASASGGQKAETTASSGQQKDQTASTQSDTQASGQTAAKSQDQNQAQKDQQQSSAAQSGSTQSASTQTGSKQSGDTSTQTKTQLQAGQDQSQGQAKSDQTAQNQTGKKQTEGETTTWTTSETKAEGEAKKLEAQSAEQKDQTQTELKTTQSTDTEAKTSTEAAAKPTQPLSEMQVSAEELIGKTVANPSGENLGEIEDLVIDPQNEDMFAVVGVGGFLGLGEKKVTIPYNDLQMSGDEIIVLTAQTKEQLKQMPEYEKDKYRPLGAE